MEGATRCRQWCWILFLLLGLQQLNGQSDAVIYGQCNPNKYSNGSEYESDVNVVLNYLVSVAARSRFSTYSSGTVNGLLQCRGDVSEQACQNCSVEASQLAYQYCSNAIGARIQLEFCFISYENYSFASVLDTKAGYSYSNPNSSNAIKGFNQTLGNLMENLASKAIMPTSDGFATGSSVVIKNRNVTIYGLVMCFPSLKTPDCFACLKAAIAGLNKCCSSQVGSQVYLSSCSAHFDYRSRFQSDSGEPHGGSGKQSRNANIGGD